MWREKSFLRVISRELFSIRRSLPCGVRKGNGEFGHLDRWTVWFGSVSPFSTEKWLGLPWKEYQRKAQPVLAFLFLVLRVFSWDWKPCANAPLDVIRLRVQSSEEQTTCASILQVTELIAPYDKAFITRKQVTFFSNWQVRRQRGLAVL